MIRKGETMTIPRENHGYIQTVLEDDSIDIHEKARCIHRYDGDLLCREYDGALPNQMTTQDIERAILESGR